MIGRINFLQQFLGQTTGFPDGRKPVEAHSAIRSSSTAVNRNSLTGEEFTRQEIAQLLELKKRDKEVRQHEMAHIAAGGFYVKGGATYQYKIGPDGRRYVVGGEVSIDTSKEPDPERTIRKMHIVERAALAPINPSPQDRAVAAKAAMQAAKAQTELIELQYKERTSRKIFPEGNGQVSSIHLDRYV